MPYDPSKDLSWTIGSRGNDKAAVADPSAMAAKLTAAMVSDSADLAAYAKALRIWNGSASAVTLLVTPLMATDDTTTGAVPVTVPAGVSTWEPIGVRRIWSTGSTGLVAALGAGTVEVLLVTL